jgi:YD repeat-containing protein
MQFQNDIAGIAGLLSAWFAFCFPEHCHAKDWDLDRAQYSRDSELSGLAGPVRTVTELTYEGDRRVFLNRVSFNAEGDALKKELYFYKDNFCIETTYTYDDRGNRTNETEKRGDLVGGSSCEYLSLQSAWNYSYEFNASGAVVLRRKSNTMASAQPVVEEWRYRYDSLGRLIQIEALASNSLLKNSSDSYSYSSGRDVLQVSRHHTSLWSSGNTFDVVRDSLYAPDGRLKQVTQVPRVVVGFFGNETRIYSDAGYLTEQQHPDSNSRVFYSHHDRQGNWTESVSSLGGRVVRQIEY